MRYLVAKWFSKQGSLVMAVKPGKELVEMMRRVQGRFGTSDPVSYTHLDVYKRQISYRVVPLVSICSLEHC